MKLLLKLLAFLLLLVIAAALALGLWYVRTKLPQREGTISLQNLSAPVSVKYDERGVPHIRAQSEADLYRVLGYVHAQDRLFQMEMARRLAKGDLAEIFGPKALDTDKLMRTLRLRERADVYAASLDLSTAAAQGLLAYLDGINQFQATHPAPMEFDMLRIPKQPFTPQDTFAVSGYLAYSFAAAFKTEPVLTYIRDQLGPEYLRVFDIDWHPEGVTERSALLTRDWQGLSQLAQLSQDALEIVGMPQLEGSNAWAMSGQRTVSGKPLLAGDPHISFAIPSVWYEAHLSAPGFELYGHHQALNPYAFLGHNMVFGWTLTMFQNDDVDFIAEAVNPENPNQVWHQGLWVDLQSRTETIRVKGQADEKITLHRSPHGPLINDAFKENYGTTPIAMWWTFLETENPLLQAFYDLNRANTREKVRAAAAQIHAPGLNIVWANAKGDIGWWGAAKIPLRPAGNNPTFILDGTKPESEKLGFYTFNFNPQEENPPRGYVLSANQQPKPSSGVPVPGYYNLADRSQQLNSLLQNNERQWDIASAQALQLGVRNGYPERVLKALLPVLNIVVSDPAQRDYLHLLAAWDGNYTRESIAATVFTQLCYEIARAAMADELGEVQFKNLLRTRALDAALPLLAADASSQWWDNRQTPSVENRNTTVKVAWDKTVAHLEKTLGKQLQDWSWGHVHQLTQTHPMGMQKPFNWLFNVGPYPVPGGRETPNNFSYPLGPAPWPVNYGPSTRRIIDFADAGQSLGINPLGQSGVLFDRHYADQTARYIEGIYAPQYLSGQDIGNHTQSTLTLQPKP